MFAPLIPVIIGALISVAASLVGRIIMALAIGGVTYVGLNAALDVFKGYFNSAMGSAGPILAGMAGTLKLDVCMSIFIAAGLARLAIAGATSDTFKKFARK